MSKPEILEKAPMNLVEVKSSLEKIRKANPDVELNFRAQKTEEYAQDFAKITLKKSEELFSQLQALEIPRLKEQHLHKLIDLMPGSDRQVKVILTGYHLTITAENAKKIAETIAPFLPKR